MPKLRCSVPDAGWVIVRDADYEKLMDEEARRTILRGARPDTPESRALVEADARVRALASGMYRCPECGRMAIEEGDAFRFFRPDDSGSSS